jgi:hypothetical protein
VSRSRETCIAAGQAADHPAFQAWMRLHPTVSCPDSLDELRPMGRKKTPVFRLHGAGPNREAVIAKLAAADSAAREHAIYSQVFPSLTRGAFKYYGSVKADEQARWIFTEDVGGEPFSPKDPRHAELAIEWLAELHTEINRLDCLPDRGLDYYFSRLQRGCDRIRQGTGNPALEMDDVATLDAIVRHAETLEQQRAAVRAVYDRLPKSLIHGDFKPKNIRVRITDSEAALYVFDWEDSGWGCPGVDMWKLNTGSYRAAVCERWSGFSLGDAEQLAKLGRLLWCFTAIEWSSGWLLHEWVENPLSRMEVYERFLAESIQEIPSWS